MESKSKISVIVVCYNQEETIAQTLDSILEQEGCSRYEILVSDDCSRDNTASIAREYEKRFPGIVKVHINAENQGVQANYFAALRRAEGEYIADCAGDDFWCDTKKLAKEESVLDNHPEASMVHTGFDYLFPDGHRERFVPETDIREKAIKSRDALTEILCGKDTPFLHLCSALYRRDPIVNALDRHPELFLNPEYKCEDLQIMAAAAAAGDVLYLPETTLCYRVGHSSISSTESFTKAFDFYFATTRLRLELLRLYGISEEMQRFAMRHYTEYLMAQAFHGNSPGRINALMAWMRRENVHRSPKLKLFYHFGRSPMRESISRLLLSRREHNHTEQ